MSRKRLKDIDIEQELCIEIDDEGASQRISSDRSFDFSPITLEDLGIVSTEPAIMNCDGLNSDDSVTDPHWIPKLKKRRLRTNFGTNNTSDKKRNLNTSNKSKYFIVKRKRFAVISDTEDSSSSLEDCEPTVDLEEVITNKVARKDSNSQGELIPARRELDAQEEKNTENNQITIESTSTPEELFVVDYGENPHERSESPLVLNSAANPAEETQQELRSFIGVPETRQVELQVALEKSQTSTKKNKAARVLGKPYLGYKKVGEKFIPCIEKPAKIMKTRCSHTNTEFKTSQTFLCAIVSEEERSKLHSDFWNLKTWDEKKAYIKALAVRRGIRRRRSQSRASGPLKKQSGHDIFINRSDKILSKVRVCKTFFLNTLCIGEDSFRRWTKDNNIVDEIEHNLNNDNDTSVIPTTSSAIHTYSSLTMPIKTWLDMLPKVPSHYCRASSKKLYVESTFRSELHMHQVYKSWCQDNNHRVASRKTFLRVLAKENIAIHHPRKDQCDTCCSYKAGNISKEEYDNHIVKKGEARTAKQTAIARASDKVVVITVDVQSVLLAPKLLASSMYYKLKLQCHNFTVYDTKTKKVTIYFWHEADGNVTANEFTSCLIDYIENLPESTEEVIVVSDGCCHQNRNRILSSALSDLSQTKRIAIQQLYLEKGHTMMEVDSVHSTIEQYIKPPIYAPSHYIARMRQARPDKPYDIKSIHYDFFRNYEKLSSNLKTIRPGKKKGDPVVVDLRSLKYLPDGSILYKLRHTEEWTMLPYRRQLARHIMTRPERLYLEQIKITESKFKHLQESKTLIDQDYHPFYDSLTYIPGA